MVMLWLIERMFERREASQKMLILEHKSKSFRFGFILKWDSQIITDCGL